MLSFISLNVRQVWQHYLKFLQFCKLSRKPFTRLISVILFLLDDSFSHVDLLANFLPEAEERAAVQMFLKAVYTRTEFAMWVSLYLDDLYFLWRSCLEPELWSWMEENQNPTPCTKDAGTHLLLYCRGLVSMQCIGKLVAESGCKQIESWFCHVCSNLLKNWKI